MKKTRLALGVSTLVGLLGAALHLIGQPLGVVLLFGVTAGGWSVVAWQLANLRRQTSAERKELASFHRSMRWTTKEILNHEGSILRRVKQWDTSPHIGAPVISPRADEPQVVQQHPNVPPGMDVTAAVARDDSALSQTPAKRDDVLEWMVEHELMLREAASLPEERYYRKPEHPLTRQIRVAVIADEFTFNSFAPEFTTLALQPNDWEAQLDAFRPDLIFVESAWKGVPDDKAPWRAQIYASARFQYENRSRLLRLVGEARRRGIPSVFWNKEDPTHFHDRVNDFVSTASKFDYILTTAEECLDEYARFHPRDQIGCLPFAAAPATFNPLGSPAVRADPVVFAGSWYTTHEVRGREMTAIFDAILARNMEIRMHDRYYQTENEYFAVPERFRHLTHPPVTHKQTADLYRNARFALNINTVTNSRTMFARRAFEAAAAGAHLISNDSLGMNELFGDAVTWSNDLSNPDCFHDVEARTVRAMNTVLREHTYGARAESILALAGIPYTSHRATTTLVASVSDDTESVAALRAYYRLADKVDRVVLLVDQKVPPHQVQSFYRKFVRPGCVVVSNRYWLERGVSSVSVLNTPHYFSFDPASPPTADQVDRALAHAQYYPGAVHVGQRAVMPRVTFGALRCNTLLPASSLYKTMVLSPDVIEYLEA